jgi:DNA-binding LacI/PurR family transcriptional regulator
MVDGLLINYTHGIPAHMQDAIESAALPVVWVNVKRPNDCVYPHDFDAGGRAVRFLIERGHRRIAFADFVHGPENEFVPHYSALDRRDGYVAAVRRAGLEERLLGGRRQLEGPEATHLATAALRDPAGPTAVVCQSPRDASLLHLAATAVGIEVPGGLSLITFGGERLAASTLEWTRLVEPREAVGRAAAEMLLERIDRPKKACPARTVAYELIAGESVAELRQA